ncbi:MAG: hypothetical protein H6738_23985 [Alphaproteobacteria bacterium]|nr:hypothetical protein [Alphaproteobacteria bacterium]MCB9699869.1 hypothetical protein [Alphaproteobacteria bacterium]
MSDSNQPLDADEVLVARAQEKLAKNRECALMASLLTQLRDRRRPWWSAAVLREIWPTSTRFLWFDKRPDVRGRLTTDLTGLHRLAARESERAFQASLIDRVMDAGDLTVEAWDASFLPEELAVHAPTATLWNEFRSRFPWDGASAEDRDLLVWLLGELLEERKEGSKTTSIMTPLYVRSAIDVRVWQEHIPLEIRVQVDGRRLRKELEGKPFTCRDELAVVKIERVVEHIPALHLKGVLDALERVLPALAGSSVEGVHPSEEEPEHTESVPKSALEAH